MKTFSFHLKNLFRGKRSEVFFKKIISKLLGYSKNLSTEESDLG